MEYRNIFDSHAHYDDERFTEDGDALLAALPEHGVRAVLNVAASMESCRTSLALAKRYAHVYCSVGVHPESAAELQEADYGTLGELAAQPKVVAIGEIGLDYHYDDASPREVQRDVFERQLRLACERSMPVIVHDRDAHEDTLALLRRYKPRGVLHCFSGSAEMAVEVARLGMYVGFTGVVTFKNARKAAEAARAVPRERLLIETDCPYMAPEPMRGQRCDSTMLVHTGTRLAELVGMEPQALFNLTCENACALFGICL